MVSPKKVTQAVGCQCGWRPRLVACADVAASSVLDAWAAGGGALASSLQDNKAPWMIGKSEMMEGLLTPRVLHSSLTP